MKLDTAFLEGSLLDYAVAQAAGLTLSDGKEFNVPVWQKCSLTGENEVVIDFKPSTDAKQAYPFVKEMRIGSLPRFQGIWDAYASVLNPGHVPRDKRNGANHQFAGSGMSKLEAEMRCFVNSKIGRAINIPDDLVELLRGDQELVDPDAYVKPSLKTKAMRP